MKQRMFVAMMMMAALAMAAQAQAVKAAPAADPQQVKDDLFDGTEQFAKNATDVTEVTMDPQTLGMVDGKDKDKAHHMRLNVVRTYTYDKPGMYDMAEVDRFRAKLNTGDWHCSVHTRSLKTGNSTDVCNKTRTDGLVETAIVTVEAKQLTFIHTITEKGAWGGSYHGWEQQSWVQAVPTPVISAELRAGLAVMGAELRAELPALMAAPHAMDLHGLPGDLDQRNGLKVPAVPKVPEAPKFPEAGTAQAKP